MHIGANLITYRGIIIGYHSYNIKFGQHTILLFLVNINLDFYN